MDFLLLLFAHLLADYPLQGEFLANMKGKNHIVLATHAGIWTGAILVAAYCLGYNITYFDVVLFFTVHAVADYMKAKPIGFYKKMDSLREGLLIDQSIHIIQIVVFLIYKNL
ncbi:DUF3307 domain-containing protein [Bacillus mobilis]|uniref:DUF3307 domain-containing protein n=2 Tax=Bacillus cereus group TaxID=86661 RepID=A0A1C4CA33_BACCE|nr:MULTISPECIES: DUF3307 domain-containing protein [Bacillus cereus group]OKA34386.1 hypothetical protein BJR07_22970 [Bacillus cereus]OKA38155.1 hypothetical protein BJR06_11960 [Bacillus cereus]SCC15961.1 Uncharacterized protein BC0861_02305 [Bacillus mobilis]